MIDAARHPFNRGAAAARARETADRLWDEGDRQGARLAARLASRLEGDGRHDEEFEVDEDLRLIVWQGVAIIALLLMFVLLASR